MDTPWSNGLLAKIASRPFGKDQSVVAIHLILAGVGDDGSLCPGLLLFRQYRQKVHESGPGGSPSPSVGDYLTGCTTCTNAQRTPTGCTAFTKRQKRSSSTAGTRSGTLKREYCRNPTWDAPKVS